MPAAEINYCAVVAFSHELKVLWTNPESPPEDANIGVLLVDVSGSMESHKNEARVAVSAVCCTSNLKAPDFKVPTPGGGTALVDTANAVMDAGRRKELGIDVERVDRLVVLTDGRDLHSTCDEVYEKLEVDQDDGSRRPVMCALPPVRDQEERDAAVAAHLSLLGVDLLVVGIGAEVKHFLHKLQTAKAPTKTRIQTTFVQRDTQPLQIAASVVAMLTSDQTEIVAHEHRGGPGPASEDEALEKVVGDAPNVQFGDLLTPAAAKELVDAAILSATAGDPLFATIESDNWRAVRGCVALFLWMAAGKPEPFPGALIGGKKSSVVDTNATVKETCNKTLSRLQNSLLEKMVAASSQHTLEVGGKTTTKRFSAAAHYRVAACLDRDTAKAVANDASWCTAPLHPAMIRPFRQKREREQEQ